MIGGCVFLFPRLYSILSTSIFTEMLKRRCFFFFFFVRFLCETQRRCGRSAPTFFPLMAAERGDTGDVLRDVPNHGIQDRPARRTISEISAGPGTGHRFRG